jgi:hypothetical protein
MHNLQGDEHDSPIYTNYNVDAMKESIIDACSEYKGSLTYMRGETDCNDMAVYLWNQLQQRGVKTLMVIGTPDGEYTPFANCDHAWLACNTPDGFMFIDPTVPMIIYNNTVYTFRTPGEVDTYMQELDESLYRSRRDDYSYMSDEEFDTFWRLVSSDENVQEANALARSHARYDPHDRPGDYSDFDYRQGYYYAKPSDMRKDLGDRW